ncbi:helix-turn-helix transcriptional regulator [Rubinisphaera italica]|uniref:Sugar-specific transcriptional regulator TrmB n=1 Tax=Rubinisphaera italica TaxID=2527969 RepID=A0A5C5XBU1_9PLAN|nr:winged helix-turn-helix transcriptional regulator [Rubinisphaera italica]TWT60496.1 Sugar-specific transcriptional regulator TrmB [Rubinisphaera italica]
MKKSAKATKKKPVVVSHSEGANKQVLTKSLKSTSTKESSRPLEHARWTFLTNHAHVLIVLHENSQMVLREVAVAVGITERAVQRIVQDLEEGGFIKRVKVGRKNQYTVIEDKSLRHPIEAHRQIGDLLSLISEK